MALASLILGIVLLITLGIDFLVLYSTRGTTIFPLQTYAGILFNLAGIFALGVIILFALSLIIKVVGLILWKKPKTQHTISKGFLKKLVVSSIVLFII